MADNKRVLTDSFLRSIQPSGIRFEVWDHGCPGFGIRAGVQGDVSFQYVYRIAGRSRRHTLGKYPGMSLHEARELYRKAAIAVSEGNDPAEAKLRLEQAKRAAITVQVLGNRQRKLLGSVYFSILKSHRYGMPLIPEQGSVCSLALAALCK
jgi:hypothetical protein